MFVQIRNSKFVSKLEIFVKIQNLWQTSISIIFFKNRNWCQNSKFLSKFDIFLSKIEICVKHRRKGLYCTYMLHIITDGGITWILSPQVLLVNFANGIKALRGRLIIRIVPPFRFFGRLDEH